jgi:hypothetical protein
LEQAIINPELRGRRFWAAAGHSLARWLDFMQKFIALINFQRGHGASV